MRSVAASCVLLLLSGYFNNPTIEQEIADKCGISVDAYKDAQAALDKRSTGASTRVGRCTLKRASNETTEGVVN